VGERLAEEEDIRLVGVVHHETSTGLLNPLKPISEAVHEQGASILVDAVSSVGGVPLLVDQWGLDLVVSVANKCLGGPPGFSSITVSQTAWDIIEQRPDRGRGWYLNLETWREYAKAWADWHPQPVTMPGQNLLAVAVALRRIMARGLDKHFQDSIRAAESVRAGMSSMGFELFLEPEWRCPLVSTFRTLPGTRSEGIARFLLEEHSIKIAQGIGELKDRLFRIGHMGMATSDEYVKALLAGVGDYVNREG
jgi:alanine-glyoxylate transaminase/serine-glyoxylate transaminase/serine-pyruvate transaminase